MPHENPGKLAELIVYAIIKDFTQHPEHALGGRHFAKAWDQLSPQTKAELTTTWIEIAEAKLKEPPR